MSDKNFSLVNLGKLSKPATKLIECVSAAIGAWYEPTRIRNEAEARGDAMITLARKEGEANNIALRAALRISDLELRRQQNIEQVTLTAVDLIEKLESEDPVDPDWTYFFIESCQDVGDEEMQSLWAKILAGEVSRPGSFSRRTMEIVRTLDKQHAAMFTKTCEFCFQRSVWMPRDDSYEHFSAVRGGQWHFIASSRFVDVARKYGYFTANFLELSGLGLMEKGNIILEYDPKDKGGSHRFSYFDRDLRFRSNLYEDTRIHVYFFTSYACELARISGAKPNENFLAEAIQLLSDEYHLELAA